MSQLKFPSFTYSKIKKPTKEERNQSQARTERRSTFTRTKPLLNFHMRGFWVAKNDRDLLTNENHSSLPNTTFETVTHMCTYYIIRHWILRRRCRHVCVKNYLVVRKIYVEIHAFDLKCDYFERNRYFIHPFCYKCLK